MLSHLDNALDIAEMHKGQGAILKKVSVVTKPKGRPGKVEINYLKNGTYSIFQCTVHFVDKLMLCIVKVILIKDFPEELVVSHHLTI